MFYEVFKFFQRIRPNFEKHLLTPTALYNDYALQKRSNNYSDEPWNKGQTQRAWKERRNIRRNNFTVISKKIMTLKPFDILFNSAAMLI